MRGSANICTSSRCFALISLYKGQISFPEELGLVGLCDDPRLAFNEKVAEVLTRDPGQPLLPPRVPERVAGFVVQPVQGRVDPPEVRRRVV